EPCWRRAREMRDARRAAPPREKGCDPPVAARCCAKRFRGSEVRTPSPYSLIPLALAMAGQAGHACPGATRHDDAAGEEREGQPVDVAVIAAGVVIAVAVIGRGGGGWRGRWVVAVAVAGVGRFRASAPARL